MKNKWIRVVVMIIVGFAAYAAAQNMNSTLGNITSIVGVILIIGGFAEIFRKQANKNTEVKS